MNVSYWQKTSKKKSYPSLEQDISTDVLIIGGGLSGIALAYYLKDTGYSITVIDQDELGCHTSGHTTAKITFLHDVIYQDIVKYYDIHYANLYYQSNLKALNEIKDIIKKENISCDFEENTSYIYTDDPQYIKTIQKEKEIFQTLKIDYIEDEQHLSSIGIENQAIFHPLKYLYALIQICQKSGVQFYEHSQAKHIIRQHHQYNVQVNQSHIQCQYLVHATRYPFIKKGFYFAKLFQKREYINYQDTYQNHHSYLCIDQIYSYRPVKAHSLLIDPQTSQWFAQDSVPIRGIPYIGRLTKYENEFIIYGFQTWGMTLSHVAGQLIADLIQDKDNPYEELYSCHYFSMAHAKKYINRIIKNNEKGYLQQRFRTKKITDIKKGEGAIVKKDHHLYAVYCDENGEYHYFSPYCPHLKCLIHFNKKSQTWDCPCHQSVYDVYGHCIEGPSLSSLKKVE